MYLRLDSLLQLHIYLVSYFGLCLSPHLFYAFSKKSGLLFSSAGGLPDSGMEPGSPVVQADSVASEPSGLSLGQIVNVALRVLEAEA